MEFLLNVFFEDPMRYLGALFAAAAAIAFLLFARGFGGGLPNLFHMRGNEQHLTHARVRAIWGLYLLVVIFALWEALRWLAGLFT